MRYYAVIDTNVIVSSMFNRRSVPGQVVELALNGPIIPLLNEEIFAEYEDVLVRNKFGFEKSAVKELLTQLRRRSIFLDRTETDEHFDDPGDVVFYEVVLTARSAVNAYLVTGNNKHFPAKRFVVTPREMLEIVNKENKKIP